MVIPSLAPRCLGSAAMVASVSAALRNRIVAIDYRWAEQIDRLPELAADLVRRQVAVIATAAGFTTALAAKGATTTIPIVFSVSEDPVKFGLVISLARPGGNLTGINLLGLELTAKRLELLREMLPAAARVAVLVNPANTANAQITLREVEAAGRAMGLQLQIFNASTSREIDAAFAAFGRERPDAVFVGQDAFFNGRRAAARQLGGAPCAPHDIRLARHLRGRRTDELRNQHRGHVSADGRVCRPHPQGHEAGRPAGRAVRQVRAGHQRANRAHTGHRNSADAAGPR
jgi:ABC transporter substrate binding protein